MNLIVYVLNWHISIFGREMGQEDINWVVKYHYDLKESWGINRVWTE